MRQSSKLGMDTLRETSRTARGCQGMITPSQIKTDRNKQTISQLLSVFEVTMKSNLEYLSTIHALRSAEFLLKYSHILLYMCTYVYILHTSIQKFCLLLQSCFLFGNHLYTLYFIQKSIRQRHQTKHMRSFKCIKYALEISLQSDNYNLQFYWKQIKIKVLLSAISYSNQHSNNL